MVHPATGLILFTIQKLSFLVKMWSFFYIPEIFYEVTFENIFRILKNSVCFQNSVVCHKPFKVITFFCVKFAPVTGIAKEL